MKKIKEIINGCVIGNVSVEDNKQTKLQITIVITAIITCIITALITSVICSNIYNRKNLASREKHIKGASGEDFKVYIPEGYNDLTKNYETLYKYDMGINSKYSLSMNGVIVAGNGVDIPSSTITINIMTYSGLREIYTQLYDDFDPDVNGDQIYSTTYHLYKEGRIPNNAPKNYKADKLGEYKAGNIKYTAYEVSYDADQTQYFDVSGNIIDEPDFKYERQHCIIALSDTKDTAEITIYVVDDNKLVEDGLNALKEFIKV